MITPATTVSGEIIPIACRCAKMPPLRLLQPGVTFLRQLVGHRLPPELPMLSYRCGDCKTVIVARAIDLGLAST